MPVVAYMSVKTKTVTKRDKSGKILSRDKMVPHYSRVKVNVKSRDDLGAIMSRKDFVRFCCGGVDMDTLIQRRVAAGRSDWYV